MERKPWFSLRRIKKEPSFILNWLFYYYLKIINKPTIYTYEKGLHKIVSRNSSNGDNYPWIIPNWDNTPRCGVNGLVLKGSTPELFRMQVKKPIELVSNMSAERRLIFVKAWNEWAEGNHLQPDLRFGKGYLQVVKDEVYEIKNLSG